MIDRVKALRLLSGSLPFFFDAVHWFLGDGQSKILGKEMKIVGNADMDEETAVFGAITTTISAATRNSTVEISIDDMCFLKEYMMVVWTINKFVERGFAQYLDGSFDEYGFPAITMSKEQVEELHKTIQNEVR